MKNRLNMKKIARDEEQQIFWGELKLPPEVEIEAIFSSEDAAKLVYNILGSRPQPYLHVRVVGSSLIFKDRNVFQEAVKMMDEAWPEEREGEEKSPSWRENLIGIRVLQPDEKKLTEEKIEVPYIEILQKYTEDEIFDIASGRKTDVTAEEVEQAKDVITRGIVANRLSMRKFSQSTPETIEKAQAGDEKAIAQVIEENTGLISQALIKWGYAPESDEFQDTMSDIKVEMIERIVPQYDPSRGAFSTFLSTAVYNFLRRGTRQKEYEEKQKEVSLEEPVEEGITLEDTLEDPTSPLAQLTLSSIRESLQTWLHMKKPDLEDVVLRIFDLKLQEYSHKQIAEILNGEGYTSKGKLFTHYMVNNYVNAWIKPALAQHFEAFRTAKLGMRSFSKELTITERKQIALDPSTPPETLVELAKDENEDVRYLVANNTSTPPETLAELVRDENGDVRFQVAEHLSAPPESLVILSKDKDAAVRQAVATNVYTPLETLTELGKDPNYLVRIFVTNNPSTPLTLRQEILDVLEKDEVFQEELKAVYTEEQEMVLREMFEDAGLEVKLVPELTEEKIEVPYINILQKYTEDEIFDIAAGRKTDITEEEVEMAKDVITRGIVANRLNMRK